MTMIVLAVFQAIFVVLGFVLGLLVAAVLHHEVFRSRSGHPLARTMYALAGGCVAAFNAFTLETTSIFILFGIEAALASALILFYRPSELPQQ